MSCFLQYVYAFVIEVNTKLMKIFFCFIFMFDLEFDGDDYTCIFISSCGAHSILILQMSSKFFIDSSMVLNANMPLN